MIIKVFYELMCSDIIGIEVIFIDIVFVFSYSFFFGFVVIVEDLFVFYGSNF